MPFILLDGFVSTPTTALYYPSVLSNHEILIRAREIE
jgi:hypothetical protein